MPTLLFTLPIPHLFQSPLRGQGGLRAGGRGVGVVSYNALFMRVCPRPRTLGDPLNTHPSPRPLCVISHWGADTRALYSARSLRSKDILRVYRGWSPVDSSHFFLPSSRIVSGFPRVYVVHRYIRLEFFWSFFVFVFSFFSDILSMQIYDRPLLSRVLSICD